MLFSPNPAKKSAQIEVITPQKAAEYLEKNTRNRPAADRHTKDLVGALRRGEFETTSDGIGFDTTGAIVNGQHRLEAIIESGVAAEMVVVRGLSPTSFSKHDKGKKRTVGDDLAVESPEFKDRNSVAGAVSTALIGLHGHRAESPTTVFEASKEFYDVVQQFLPHLRKNPLCRRTAIVGAFLAAVRTNDPFPGPKGRRSMELVLDAARRLGTNEWNGPQDPMLALQRRLLRTQKEKDQSGTSIGRQTVYALTVAAIRASLSGKPLTRMEPTTVDFGDQGDVIRKGTEAGPARSITRSEAA